MLPVNALIIPLEPWTDCEQLAADARVTVRRGGAPDPEGTCVVYWMQRAQRGNDNPALDLAVQAGNLLGKPVVAFFALLSFFPEANLRHFAFLVQGLPDIAEALQKRGIGLCAAAFTGSPTGKAMCGIEACAGNW